MRRSPIWNFNPYRPKVSPFDKLMIEDVLDITQSINVKANPRWRWFLLSNSKRRLGWESLDEEQASWDAWVLLMTNDQETEGPQQAAPPLRCFEDSYHDTTLGMGRHLNWHYIELAKKFGSFCNISWKNPNKDFGQTSILFYLCTTGIVNSFRGEKKSNDIPYNLKFEGFICPMDHLDEKVFTGWPDVHLFLMGCA